MNEIEISRSNHLVDPSMHIWGWEIPVYLFLGGVAAGIMIVSALVMMRVRPEDRSPFMRWMPFTAPLMLSAGMFALWLDLENPFHVFRFYMVMRPSSAMSWGAWILLLIYPATILFGLAGLDQGDVLRITGSRVGRLLRLERPVGALVRYASARARGLGWANVLLGIALGGYTGVLLASMGARAAWSSMLLAPLFLVSGLSTGAAVVMLFPIEKSEHELVRRWDMWAIAAELVLLALFFLGLYTGGSAGREAVSLFFGGPFTAAFWALVVAAGLLTPLALEATEGLRKLRPTLLAPALILLGGLALRWILVAAGQA